MDFSKGVLFDPGYSKHVLAFAPNIDAAYSILLSSPSGHQRKFKFQMIYPQMLKILENTVCFYLGCLLWATFITQNFENEPKEILDNCYLDREVEEESMLYEVNYAIEHLEKLPKDCKYYTNKPCNISNEWKEILLTYKDFLKSNNFLVKAKSTADIALPEKIKKNISKEDLNTILETIENVVITGDLKKLMEIKSLIF